MKTTLNTFCETLDILLSKVESIETIMLSGKPDECKFKDYMNVEQLLKYLEEERAITLSASKIYKLTATSGGIPFKKAWGKLVFKRAEIDLWIDTQLNPQTNQALTGKGKAKNNKSINNFKNVK